jgi:hypothetical protein
MKLPVLFVFLSIGFSASAQMAWGPKGSVNYSYAGFNTVLENGGNSYRYKGYDGGVGFNYGLFFRMRPADVFMIQPELTLSSNNYVTTVGSLGYDTTLDIATHRLSIPVLAGFVNKEKTMFFAGPVYTKVFQNGPSESVFWSEDIKESFSGGNFAFQFGIGKIVSYRMAFDIRYEMGLGQWDDVVNINKQRFEHSYKSSVLLFSLQINFADKPAEDEE